MSTIARTIRALGTGLLALVLVAGTLLAASPVARADAVVFLTRLNGSIRTYPASNSFSVGYTGTTTAPTSKMSVYLNVTDTYKSGLEIASTTGSGTATTTADIFRVNNAGCVQLTSTSSATQIVLNLSTKGATSTFAGTAYWSYGTCTP